MGALNFLGGEQVKLRNGMIALAITTTTCCAGSAAGQSYPTKPIRLLVPYAPGAATDSNARVLAPKLGASLGQQVIVDNRPGATGIVVMCSSLPAVRLRKPTDYTINLWAHFSGSYWR